MSWDVGKQKATRRDTQRCTKYALRRMAEADEWLARWRPRFNELGGSVEAVSEAVRKDLRKKPWGSMFGY